MGNAGWVSDYRQESQSEDFSNFFRPSRETGDIMFKQAVIYFFQPFHKTLSWF